MMHGVSNGVVSGWGNTFANQPSAAAPETLQFLNTVNMLPNECRPRQAPANQARILETNICAFTMAGQGICVGDSGGGLVVGREIAGIASFAVPCATGVPDVYTQVFPYISWI